MALKKDYIPRNDADFNTFFKNLTQYVTAKCSGSSPEWDHIPAKELEAFNGEYADWYTAYAPALNPHTPAVTRAKDIARAKAEKAIRLRPDFGNPHRHRAFSYMQKGNYTQARADVNRALQIDPDYQSARELSAELQQRGY